MTDLTAKYKLVRMRTEQICRPLQTEDYVVQPIADVSPPKWHLGHTTWFFEVFVLLPYLEGYCEYNTSYNFVFNSYYENAGARVIRTNRGNLSRPTVQEIYKYRDHVDEAMHRLLSGVIDHKVRETITLGLNHEEQHQELLVTDIKYILGHNPLFPAYDDTPGTMQPAFTSLWLEIPGGIYEMGHRGAGFCFDNELGRHTVYLRDFKIALHLVTNADYLAFIVDGGYSNHNWWHSEGWDWVKNNRTTAPMYWHNIDGDWGNYTLSGFREIMWNDPVCHISFYEAAAYAAWKGARLPTEFEWEAASGHFHWGRRWEWTGSAYLPYPGFVKAEGAIGEYNGKFMVNQMVLRGASDATPPGHSRATYRNFFHPPLRWQFTGIRLAL